MYRSCIGVYFEVSHRIVVYRHVSVCILKLSCVAGSYRCHFEVVVYRLVSVCILQYRLVSPCIVVYRIVSVCICSIDLNCRGRRQLALT